MMRIGSLCSGYGGLDMAVHTVLGGELAWVADNDEAAARILAHRFPGAPNHTDIAKVNWSAVKPVEILVAGFPCQDVSCAGVRRGLRAGTRTGTWSHVAKAIGALRPPLVFLENVRGLLNFGADSNMEPCPWCLGDSGDESALRALGAVLGDLASLGFDAEWQVVSAAETGAPHRRERVFILAWPTTDPDGATGDQRRLPAPGQAEGGRPRADTGGRDRTPAPDTERGHSGGRSDEPFGRPYRRAAAIRDSASGNSRDALADPERDGRERRSAGGAGEADEPGQGSRAAPAGRSSRAAADSGRTRLCEHAGEPPAEETGTLPGDKPSDSRGLRSAADWGPYALAIRRWEHVTGRPAPCPTEPGQTGQRLSPRFVEFLMGLPEGWVTGVPGLSRNAQLKALGNGVVPQQAALALALLLERAGFTEAGEAA